MHPQNCRNFTALRPLLYQQAGYPKFVLKLRVFTSKFAQHLQPTKGKEILAKAVFTDEVFLSIHIK